MHVEQILLFVFEQREKYCSHSIEQFITKLT